MWGTLPTASLTMQWTLTFARKIRAFLPSPPPSDFLRLDPFHSGSNTAALGIAVDWGNITSTPEPAVWCAGVVGDPSIQYRSPDNLVRARRPYFMADFRDAIDAVSIQKNSGPSNR